VQVGRSQRAR